MGGLQIPAQSRFSGARTRKGRQRGAIASQESETEDATLLACRRHRRLGVLQTRLVRARCRPAARVREGGLRTTRCFNSIWVWHTWLSASQPQLAEHCRNPSSTIRDRRSPPAFERRWRNFPPPRSNRILRRFRTEHQSQRSSRPWQPPEYCSRTRGWPRRAWKLSSYCRTGQRLVLVLGTLEWSASSLCAVIPLVSVRKLPPLADRTLNASGHRADSVRTTPSRALSAVAP